MWRGQLCDFPSSGSICLPGMWSAGSIPQGHQSLPLWSNRSSLGVYKAKAVVWGLMLRQQWKPHCYLATHEEWQRVLEKNSRTRSLWPCLLGSPGAPGSTPTQVLPMGQLQGETACLLQELAIECQEENSRRQKPGLLMWVLPHHI